MKYLFITILLFLTSCWFIDLDADINTTQTNTMEIEKNKNISDINDSIDIDREEKVECFMFDDFSDTQKNNWLIVNDWVMWGKSIWDYEIQSGTFNFSGFINTNGGGFSSVRAWLPSWILTEYNTIKIKAKPDNRNYQITFRDSNRRWVSHRSILSFKNTWEMQEVIVDMKSLEPVFFWRRVDAADFQKENAREIGFILNDWIDGNFSLIIDSISFCK